MLGLKSPSPSLVSSVCDCELKTGSVDVVAALSSRGLGGLKGTPAFPQEVDLDTDVRYIFRDVHVRSRSCDKDAAQCGSCEPRMAQNVQPSEGHPGF